MTVQIGGRGMGRYAVVDDASHEVVNVIEWDGIRQWEPPAGCSAIETLPTDTDGNPTRMASPGDTVSDGRFIEPPEPIGPSPRERLQAEYRAATPDEQRAILAKRLGYIP